MKDKVVFVSSRKSLLNIGLIELVGYLDLVLVLARRDLLVPYKQSVLGPAWFFVEPLLSSVIFTLVFGQIIGVSTDGNPQYLFYLCGTTCWGFFSGLFQMVAGTFIANKALYSKVYFPRLVPPVVSVATNSAKLIVQLMFVAIFWMYFSVWGGYLLVPSSQLIVLPATWMGMTVFACGCGLIISSVTAKYRDIHYLIPFGVQLWMYASPVVYPVSMIPEKYQWIAFINPMATYLEGFRISILGKGTISIEQFVVSCAVSLVVLLLGLVLFSRTEKNFMDTV